MSASLQTNASPAAALNWRRWTLVIAGVGVLAVWFLAFTASDPLFLAPFRESQTAISADWLLREPAGGALAYQTPALGPPWRLPLEFPVFQQLTAWVAATGVGVAQAGRLVSLVCWIGCLGVMARLMPDWGLPRRWVAPALALLAVAPLHSAYAAAHLIESLALLASVLHVWAFWRCSRGAGPGWWLCAVLAGVAVALIKITSWLPAAAIAGVITLMAINEAWRSKAGSSLWVRCAGLAAVGVIGLAAGLAWSRWSATVREANPLASYLFAKGPQQSWIFGNLRDRLSPKLWVLLAGKHLILLFGPLGVAIPWVLWKGLRAAAGTDPRLRAAVWIPFIGYAAHVGALFPLHLRHDYYLFGSGIFLAAAVAAALALVDSQQAGGRWVRWFAPWLAVSMASAGLAHEILRRGYHDVAADAALDTVGAVREPGALLLFGFDWSPRVPFSAGRKALMVPEERPSRENLAALDEALKKARGTPFAAALIMGSEWNSAVPGAAARCGLDPSRKYPFCVGGYLLLQTNAQPSRVLSATAAPELAELALRSLPAAPRSGLVFWRWPGSGRPGDGFEFVVRRESDAFWVRSRGLQLIRLRRYYDGAPAR